MRAKILFLLKYYLFWILLSVVAKILFLLYEGNHGLEGTDYLRIFFRGLRMDLSLGGYILLLSCVLMAFSPWIKDRLIQGIFSGMTVCLLVVFWTIVVVDLELFKNWGYHLDATPLLYLKTPKEALASTSGMLIAGLLILLSALVIFSFYFYRRFISRSLQYASGKGGQAIVFLLLGGSMIIPIRGGFNLAPMNSSFVFFHKTNMFANQAAINAVWNFIYEVEHIHKIKGKFRYMPSEEAHRLKDSLFPEGGNTRRLLKTDRPNVVVLLLESFTARAVEALGGEAGVTPHLNELIKEGVLFSEIYATGNRSDRGMTGVISAYPSYPNFSLLKYPNKTLVRPRFPKDLEANGYHTRFYYAGDINFGGFRSYITMSFQDMVTEEDFSGEAKAHTFKWGVHDEYMFERLAEDVAKAPQPFMYMAFNMSSHEPFEVPMETKIPGNTEEKKFLNAIYYSDRCIGDFIRKCKESGVWENTLFVLIADHSTIKIGDLQPHEPEAYRIPMIFSGGALNVQDTVVTTLGSQTDLVATLLAQLGIDHSEYKYSKDLLNDAIVPFAFYAYSNAAGMITEEGTSVFNLKNGEFIQGDSLLENNRLLKAYLQVLDEDVN